MAERFDVCVIGVGAMGAAACLELARRGVRVVGLERDSIPCETGSSVGQTRLIRKAYFEHKDYVPLLERAYLGWDRLGLEVSSPLLYRTGLLYAGPEGGPLIAGVRLAAREFDLRIDEVDRTELARSFPAFRIPEELVALFEPEGGFVLAEEGIAAMARRALDLGAALRGRETVREFRPTNGGVSVVTDRGEIHADKIVVTAGAWSGDLLRDLGVDLTVTRQIVGFVSPGRSGAFDLGRLPCFAFEEPGEPGLCYGFPRLPAWPSFKVARHSPGSADHPSAIDREPTAADEESFRPVFRYLQGGERDVLGVKVCLYTYSPDEHFILDRHPEHERVVLACGFSGHGFKFAPVVGEALADLALRGRTDLPVGFLSLSRFDSGPGA